MKKIKRMYKPGGPIKGIEMGKKLLNDEETPVTLSPEQGSTLTSVVPYASNVINGLRRLPGPAAPVTETPINPNLVNYDADRGRIQNEYAEFAGDTNYRVGNRTIAQGLKAKALAGVTSGLNSLAQEEGNTNAQIKNQTNFVNQGVQMRNVERQNNFNTEQVARNLKQQEFESENIANLSDKAQMQQRDKSLMELERRKLGLLPKLYENGVFDRNLSKDNDTAIRSLKKFGGEYQMEGMYEEGGEIPPGGKRPISSVTNREYENPTEYTLEQVQSGKVTDPNILRAFKADPKVTRVLAGTDIHPNGNRFDNQVVEYFRDPRSTQLNPVGSMATYKNGDQAPATEKPILFKNGGIHIKPSHRGRFTAYKERTGKTTEEALHSSNPHVRQMANFARNAAKWHHEYGGELNMTLLGQPSGDDYAPVKRLSTKQLRRLYIS